MMCETDAPKEKARALLAQFIADAAAAINESYWFSIRGECESSLCVHTMLTMDEYCELLYVAGLVRIGKKGPELPEPIWREFLHDEELCSKGDIQNAVAVIDRAEVDLNKLKVVKGPSTKPRRLLFLRIGGYGEEGERVKASTQYRMEIPPPGFNRKLTTAHRRLRRELHDIIGQADIDTIKRIKEWIDWDQLMECLSVNHSIDIHNNSNEEEQFEQHQSSIISPNKVNTQPSIPYADENVPITPSPTRTIPRKPHYTSNNPLSKYTTLNFLDLNLMVRGDGSEAVLSRIQMDNVLRDIVQFKRDHNEDLSFISTNSRTTYALQMIPMASNSNTFLKKSKHNKWVENLLSNIIVDGNITDGFECIMEYMLQRHEKTAREVLRGLGVTPKVMNEFEVAATLDESGITLSQWREIVRCLKSYMQLDRICVPEKMYSRLATNIQDITTGVFHYQKNEGDRKQTIQWWAIDPAIELVSKLESLVNSIPEFNPENVEYIQSVYSGDHGQKKLRMATKLLVKMFDEEEERWIVHPVGDVDCGKDNGLIVKNTVLESLQPGINKVIDSSIQFNFDVVNKKWECKLVPKNSHGSNPLGAFLCGDIKFLMMMVGREDFDTYWCLYCNLNRKDWQSKHHEDGELWTLDGLRERAKYNQENNLDGINRIGVREDPYFNFDMEQVIWPLLHGLIGIGNNLLSNLVEFGDCQIQCLPRSEYKMIDETKKLEMDLVNARQNKKEWEEKYKPEFKILERKEAKLKDWLDAHKEDTDIIELKKKELDEVAVKLRPLKNEIDSINKVMKDNPPKIKTNKGKLDEFKKARKNQEESVSTRIDNILKTHGIRRAAYHGGDLQGTNVIRFMEEADLIMNGIQDLFLEARDQDRCKYTEDQIKFICNEFALTLTIWDAVFAMSQRTDLDDKDLEELQKMIDLGMDYIRAFQMSVTSKLHGTEKHMVKQIGKIQGGIGKKFEYWMEKYHQDGVKLDLQHRNTKSMEQLARVRLKRQSISCLPEVQQLIQNKRNEHTRGKRKVTIEREKAAREAKRQRRDVLTRVMGDRESESAAADREQGN